MRIEVLVLVAVLVSCGGDQKNTVPVNKQTVTQQKQETAVVDDIPFNYLENAHLKGPVKTMRYMTYDVPAGDEKKRYLSSISEGNVLVQLDEKGWMIATTYFNEKNEKRKTDSTFFNDYAYPAGMRSYNAD